MQTIPQNKAFILNPLKYSWILLASRVILYRQTNMTTMIGACLEKKFKNVNNRFHFWWKIYLMVLFIGTHWTVIFSSKMNFNPFSMSMNQFMNDLVWTLKISIYRNTLINTVLLLFFHKSNFRSISISRNEWVEDSLIIGHLFWMPPAKPKINYIDENCFTKIDYVL